MIYHVAIMAGRAFNGKITKCKIYSLSLPPHQLYTINGEKSATAEMLNQMLAGMVGGLHAFPTASFRAIVFNIIRHQ